MEQPDELILNVASGISSLTETDLEKTSRDICQVTEDEIEKIAQPVDLRLDYVAMNNEPHAKRPCLTFPTKSGDDNATEIDEVSESESLNSHVEGFFNDSHFEKTIGYDDELSSIQKQYSFLVEDVSTIGEGCGNQLQGEQLTEQESWLCEHTRKLDDLYYEELNKIHENMEYPTEINEDQDWEFSEHSDNPEEMLKADKPEVSVNHESQQDKPVYEGCPITVSVSMLLIMTLAMRHGLTGEALQDILTLISLHCISPNYCVESLRRFKQFFGKIKSPLVFHHYCSHCFLYLDDKNTETCPNSLCQKSLKGVGNKCFFIEIPIVSQLQALFNQALVWEMVTTYRFNRESTDGVLGDIYDGTLYRQHWDSGFLNDSRNISFIYNTDGVPIFKSSKFSLWPLFLAINELPYSHRFKRDNMLLAGVWFGPDKPFMLTYLKPFHSVFNQLETRGVNIVNPSGEEITVRAILLCGSCDLPARCLVCNSIQYNGYYGCLRCRQSGKSLKTAKGGHVHVYPFIETDPSGPLRTKLGMMRDAQQAVQQKSFVNGIKGPSWFAALKHHDMVLGTAVDYMHCALEGVMKLLLELWFTSKESSEPFNISSQVEEVDKRIAEIKPPNRISRCPRSIEGHRKYWKANELRAFLFFYGAMVLRGILPDVYYEHFMLFSEAIFTLCLTNVTLFQIAHAERLLLHFCIKFGKLYSERYQTANLHSLLHMPEDVRNLGPLWTHSTFPFESLNGDLLKLFHGTQNIVFQIVSAVNINRALPTLSKALVDGSDAQRFYSKLNFTLNSTNEVKLAKNMFAVGKVTIKHISADIFTALTKLLGHLPETTTCKFFFRLKIGKGMYHSLGYERVNCRNSYTIQFEERNDNEKAQNKFGFIKEFLQYQTPCRDIIGCHNKCDCPIYNVAIVQTLEETNNPVIADRITGGTASHITICKRAEGGKCVAIELDKIIQKCIYMDTKDFPGFAFVAVFPNMIEKD